MNLPLVSILMTSYNREKYIASAIKSVLASNYKNIELVILDDVSTDKTVEIARSFEEVDARVKVFVNKENLGDYANRNMVASLASGTYLKYVDADDLIYPWGIELLVNMMESFPEAGWGLCSLPQDQSRVFPFMLQPKDAYFYHYKGPGLFHKAPLSSIIKKSCFEEVGGFSNLRMVGDFEMWHRLAQRFPVVLMPHGIVWYRVHGEQEMNSYLDYLPVYERIKLKYLFAENCPLPEGARLAIMKAEKHKVYLSILKTLLSGKFVSLNAHWKQLRQHFRKPEYYR